MGCPPCPSLAQDSDPFENILDDAKVAESESERAVRLFNEGQFTDAAELAQSIDEGLGKYSAEQRWVVLQIESWLAQGQPAKAIAVVESALQRFEDSIRIRWAAIEAYRFASDEERADGLIREISDLARARPWKFRDPPNQIVLGRYFLSLGADAKEVLKTFYDPVAIRNPKSPEIFLAIGELALEKHDYALAAENFAKAIELQPANPDAHCLLAQAFLPSDSERASKAINAALKINPNHVPALLLVIDQRISAEDYAAATEMLESVLAVNPLQSTAWAYKAVLAHLDNDPIKEGEFRQRALDAWQSNPAVDHIIGRELSEKYRFAEGERYQRRSLVYDPNYLPAKMQLANDLLRLGQELEGWKLADEVFTADQFSVVAHNLVTLREEISGFRTIEADGFVVRMDPFEADVYGDRVVDLLTRAKQKLCEKYDVELESPIFIEIFPQQKDFAIRTFGLPGGSGFLGVCFGRVVTMNSPAAQGANLTSWESVLWHEFCHVVTLQKTKNKMPRWLSEGISVYEEQQANTAWGERNSLEYRKMLLGEELTPVSKLSGAFLRPPSPMHLQFAYYQSSLVVEYLVEEYGIGALRSVLAELALGTPINDALRRHVAPVEFLDQKFQDFAHARAEAFAADADWTEPQLPPDATPEQWARFNQEHPRNVVGLMSWSAALLKAEAWPSAAEVLEQTIELAPESVVAYRLLVGACAKQPESAAAIRRKASALEQLVALDASQVEPLVQLLELKSANGDWAAVKRYADELAAVNPLIITPHRYLALAAEKTKDAEATVRALTALAKMNPLDPADIHFRLASALAESERISEAKRAVLIALEQAPRYRAAHRLLLELEAAAVTTTEQETTPTAKKIDESDESKK